MTPHLHAIHIWPAYSFTLVGAPLPDEVKVYTIKHAETVFGNHLPVFYVEPEIKTVTRRKKVYPMVPRWAHAARLEAGPVNPGDDGTVLLVVWFADTPSVSPPEISPETWKEHSQGWSF